MTATARFAEVSCSQCGRSFGAGTHGYSHCDQHPGPARDRLLLAAPDLRAICAELEGVIDEQVYDAMKSFGNDPPDDAEFNVNLTARQIFALAV